MLSLPVEPMLAAAVPDLPAVAALPGGCVFEPKFDGYRALVFVDSPGPAGGPAAEGPPRVRVQSRGGHDITVCFPDIAAAAAEQIPPGTVLDGELVIWGEGRLDFPALQTRLASRRHAARLAAEHPASMMVFDVLAVAGTDVRALPLAERYALLDEVLAGARPPIQRVPSTTDRTVAEGWLADYARVPGLGVEGLVIKGAATRYTSGKRGWVKYRIRDTHDLIVGAVIGTLAAPSRLVLGYRDARGRLRVAGSTVPLGRHQQAEVGGLLSAARGEHPWPEQMPGGWLGQWVDGDRTVIRVEPRLVVEVSADTSFEHGRFRHQMRYVRACADKAPEQVTRPGGG